MGARKPSNIPIFKDIPLSLKQMLWIIFSIAVITIGVYIAWQLTSDDAKEKLQEVTQPAEDDEAPTTTTTAPVDDQEVTQPAEDDEAPTTTTTAPVDDQEVTQPAEDDEAPTTTTTAPVDDQEVTQPAEDDEAPTTTTTAPVDDQEVTQPAEDDEAPTTTTTAPVDDQEVTQPAEDDEAPTTTTKTWVHANIEFEAEHLRIDALMSDCFFDIHPGVCSYPQGEANTENIVQATRVFLGCDYDFENKICRGMTSEEFQELLDKLACPEGWTLVDGFICDPVEWHET